MQDYQQLERMRRRRAARMSVGSVVAPSVTILDTFTGTDFTLLENHTPDVHPVGSSFWTVSTPGWANLQSGKLHVALASQNARLNLTQRASLVTADLDWTGGNQDLGLYTRMDTLAQNGWIFDYLNSTGVLTIFERTANVDTQRATLTIGGWAPGSGVHNLKLTDNGTLMALWFDTVQRVTFSSTNKNTNTWVGLYCGGASGNTNHLWDNFNAS